MNPRVPWWVLPALGAGVLLEFTLLAAYAVMFGDHDLKVIAITSASNYLAAIISYYFGSSIGSAKKDDAALARTP